MSNPVRKGNTASWLQDSKSLSQCALLIGHVKQCFLAYYDINAGIRQRDLQNITFNDANTVLQADQTR